MRTTFLALALLAAGCTLTPDVSKYEPKAAADCPGQKACGWRCVDVDDPQAGCGPATCEPCPAGPAHTAPICAVAQACAVACLPGFAAADGDPAHGCALPVAADPANCGASGHACPAGVACLDGMCQGAPVTEVAATGAAPRGLALVGSTFYWAVDPPQPTPAGALRSFVAGGVVTTVAVGLGHPTFVRAAAGPEVAVIGTDPTSSAVVGLSYAFDPTTIDAVTGYATDLAHGGGSWGALATGLALTPTWMVTASGTGVPDDGGNYVDSADYLGLTGYVDFSYQAHVTSAGGVWESIISLGEGGRSALDLPILWAGWSGGVSRFEDLQDGWGYDVASGMGVYFDLLTPTPRPDRVAAVAGATPADPATVWFLDLNDGSVWKGLAPAASGGAPWRVVRGTGPRTAMDLAADAAGVVWSDLEAGELWAADPAGQVYRLASGVHPWAIALTPERVYFTDVAAQQIRSVAR
jgi:hypothetical protein